MVRFPSGQEPGFGGQAAYLMRIFGIDGDTITEKTLENTPDGDRLAADAVLKQRLVDYVRQNAEAIDLGVYQLPDEFLARKVVSFTTFGSTRTGNHPFLPLVKPQDVADLDYAKMRLARSPQALIERLDNNSCQGCHQAGSTAGFHFIGLDDKTTSPLNKIEVGISPHFHAEIPRRAAYLEAVMRDRQPDRFRPLSFAPPANGRTTRLNMNRRAWRCRAHWLMTPANLPMTGSAAPGRFARSCRPHRAPIYNWRSACCRKTVRTCFPAIPA